MQLALPASYVEIEQEEMMYLDGGYYLSNKDIKAALLIVGVNPAIGVGLVVLKNAIARAGTALGTRLGLLGGPKGALFGTIIGWSISRLSAGIIAHALIQGKGINISLIYTKWGNIPYGVDVGVQ